MQTDLEPSDELNINFGQMIHIFKSHWRLMALISIISLSILSFFIFFVYQERYKSEAMVSLDADDMPEFITQGVRRNVQVFQEVDPFKTQDEILKSPLLEKKIFKALKSQHLAASVQSPKELTTFLIGVLKAKHIKSTPYIRLAARWSNPQEAQKIAQVYLSVYKDFSDSLSKKSIEQQKQILQLELADAEKNLQDNNQKIRHYQEAVGDVDIDSELSELVAHSEELKKRVEDTRASMAEAQAESNRLQKLLGLNPDKALSAVANGQNTVYTGLISQLNDTEKDYQSKLLTYTPSHPYMLKLKEKIEIMKKQLVAQTVATLGPKSKESKILIQDDARKNLVQSLAQAEARYASLQKGQEVNTEQLNEITQLLRKYPTEQVTLSELKLQQKSFSDIIERLKESIADVNIHSSYQELHVISEPNLPEEPAFPNKIHLFALAAMACLVLPAGIIHKYHSNIQARAPQADFVEQLLNIPILSVLPWLPKKPKPAAQHQLESAYQNLVINLKSEASKTKKTVFTVASVYAENRKTSSILTNLGLYLAESGDKVILVDTDLDHPTLTETFQTKPQFDKGIVKTVESLNQMLANPQEVKAQNLLALIQSQVSPSNVHSRLDYLNASESSDKAFELFQSKGFQVLVNALKVHYDWVLFDASTLSQTVLPYAILNHTDGLILLVEQGASKEQVAFVSKKVQQLDATIVGAVLRELPW